MVRSHFRRRLGREYYIFRRYLTWNLSKNRWAKKSTEGIGAYIVFEHKSLILRPLKDVEMYLQINKRRNLELAILELNDVEIKPGETFSFWKLVGRPNSKKGYLEGLVLNQGKIDKAIGGGLCQLGNLLFWIFAHSPLKIIERHRHSYDVFPDTNRKVPFGAGATLSYNYVDLQVYNDSEYSFLLKLWIDDENLNGQLLSDFAIQESYSIEERNHMFVQQDWGAYSRHNQIFRLIKNNAGETSETLLFENHALVMYCPFLTVDSNED